MEWPRVFELLIQFPVAGMNLVGIFFAFRFLNQRDARLDDRLAKFRDGVREDTNREIDRLREVYDSVIASKDAELTRLRDDLTAATKRADAAILKKGGG